MHSDELAWRMRQGLTAIDTGPLIIGLIEVLNRPNPFHVLYKAPVTDIDAAAKTLVELVISAGPDNCIPDRAHFRVTAGLDDLILLTVRYAEVVEGWIREQLERDRTTPNVMRIALDLHISAKEVLNIRNSIWPTGI